MAKLEPSFAWLGEDGNATGTRERIKHEALSQRRDAALASVGLLAPPVTEEARAKQEAWAEYRQRVRSARPGEDVEPLSRPEVVPAAAVAAAASSEPRPLSAEELARGTYLAASEDMYQMEVGRR